MYYCVSCNPMRMLHTKFIKIKKNVNSFQISAQDFLTQPYFPTNSTALPL